MTTRRHDIVVFGATSFVGQILCRYLLEQFGADGSPSWAMAGRSIEKLEQVRSALGRRAARLPLLVADAADEDSLRQLCAGARVVVSTVGPYALYGEPLVKVCAETGTDYCDLTGEVQWIRRMIRSYEPRAKKSGARIVHCCGFDSIPSDLGVHFLQQASLERYGKPCTTVKMRVRSAKGGFSGGTVASLMNVLKEAAADPKLRKELANPYSLCPKTHAPGVRQSQVSLPEFDADFQSWVAPFVMAAINTRIVHRSNALSKHAYGKNFRYDEAVLTGPGLKGRLGATGLAAGIAGVMAAGSLAPLRAMLGRFVLPEPGEGPSEEQQAKGGYDLRFFGRTADGQTLRARVTGDRDPGYGSTAKMLGQAAACLALDSPRKDTPGGFWTPATIFGERLTDRLVRHAGISFELLDA
jgi:short subunit dehydrogenase-like uncharacterized protein